MGFSAFLSMPMAKEKEIFELKPVDEEEERVSRFVRLRHDTADDFGGVEEFVELPPVRVGKGALPVEGQIAATKEELKLRSAEPDLSQLIDPVSPEEGGDEWAQAHTATATLPWGWVALVAFAFLGALLWSVFSVNRADEKLEDIADKSVSILEEEERQTREAALMVEGIEKVVRRFFDSRSVEEMLLYVRHPERVAPLMASQYGKTPLSPSRVLGSMNLDPLTIGDRASFWMVTVTLEGQGKNQILVEAVAGEKAKVDWETYVCYQPMPWDEFAESRPGGYTGDFRVYAQPDTYYSHEFGDGKGLASFRLTALNSEEVLHGYAANGSETAQIMTALTATKGGAEVPLILRLHLPDGLESKRGVLIRAVVCPRWVYLDNPLDSSP